MRRDSDDEGRHKDQSGEQRRVGGGETAREPRNAETWRGLGGGGQTDEWIKEGEKG